MPHDAAGIGSIQPAESPRARCRHSREALCSSQFNAEQLQWCAILPLDSPKGFPLDRQSDDPTCRRFSRPLLPVS